MGCSTLGLKYFLKSDIPTVVSFVSSLIFTIPGFLQVFFLGMAPVFVGFGSGGSGFLVLAGFGGAVGWFGF